MYSTDTPSRPAKQDSQQERNIKIGVIKVIPSIDPHHTRIDHHAMAVRANQQYQLKQALREAKARRRAEPNAAHRPFRRYSGLIPRRTSPAPR